MLYWIVPAMFPQFLITLNEELEEIPVTVRVGQAVNTVAQAGTRHGISGVSSDFIKNAVSIEQLTTNYTVPNSSITSSNCNNRTG